MNQYHLRATFFVESLFASAVGMTLLRRIVDLIQGEGQDVQLHLHTEWVGEIDFFKTQISRQQHLCAYSEAEQTNLIALALDNLNRAGANKVCAFRAGNFRANAATLRALRNNGIEIDSSVNASISDSKFGLDATNPLIQPCLFGDVVEFPITCISDYPGHLRHLQLAACSTAEIENALLSAWNEQWKCCVILFHSFELMRTTLGSGQSNRRSWISARRFRKLCQFLARNRDKFSTRTFADIAPEEYLSNIEQRHLSSPIHFTAFRHLEQLAGRIWG